MNHQKRNEVLDRECDGNTMMFEPPEPRHEACKVCGGEVDNYQKYCSDCEYEMKFEQIKILTPHRLKRKDAPDAGYAVDKSLGGLKNIKDGKKWKNIN